jgi:hypothetical protein
MHSKKGERGNLYEVTHDEFIIRTYDELEKIALSRGKSLDKDKCIVKNIENKIPEMA